MGRVTYIRPDMESMLKTSTGGWSAPTPVMLYRMGMSLSLSDRIWKEEQTEGRVRLQCEQGHVYPTCRPHTWPLPGSSGATANASSTLGTGRAGRGQGFTEGHHCTSGGPPGDRGGQDTIFQEERVCSEHGRAIYTDGRACK